MGAAPTRLALLLALAACGGEPEAPAPATAPSPSPATATASVKEAPAGALPAITPPTHRVKTPAPATASPDLELVLGLLGEVVDAYAGDPDNPWAISHGLLARGEGFTLTDGRPAVDFLFAEYGVEQELAGRTLVGFPRSRGELRVEPHTDLILKNLTEIGVSPDRQVAVADHPHEVGDLWGHSLLTTWIKTDGSSSYDAPNDMPWGMQGLAAWAPPGLEWQAWEGTRMRLEDLSKLLVHVLHSESAFMLQAMAAGEPFDKRGQGIFKYTCGGAHLLQGAAFVVARGYGGEAEREKIALQGPLLLYRFPIELSIYARAIAEHPDKELILMAQQLKFVGHWLESVHKLAASGLFTPDGADQLVMGQALGVLVETVARLKQLGALDNLPAIRAQNEQLYLDLVGDSAHAIDGAELALGRAEYIY